MLKQNSICTTVEYKQHYWVSLGNIDITIKATPCNGDRECKDIDDEDCGQNFKVLIITLVIVLVGIILLSLYVHISTSKNYPAIIHDGPPIEAINDRRRSTLYPIPSTIEYGSNSKGNILAHIKVSNKFLHIYQNIPEFILKLILIYLFVLLYRIRMIC